MEWLPVWPHWHIPVDLWRITHSSLEQDSNSNVDDNENNIAIVKDRNILIMQYFFTIVFVVWRYVLVANEFPFVVMRDTYTYPHTHSYTPSSWDALCKHRAIQHIEPCSCIYESVNWAIVGLVVATVMSQWYQLLFHDIRTDLRNA